MMTPTGKFLLADWKNKTFTQNLSSELHVLPAFHFKRSSAILRWASRRYKGEIVKGTHILDRHYELTVLLFIATHTRHVTVIDAGRDICGHSFLSDTNSDLPQF